MTFKVVRVAAFNGGFASVYVRSLVTGGTFVLGRTSDSTITIGEEVAVVGDRVFRAACA